MWDTLARDFAPWPVVNRGFGGAVVSQINHFAPRLLSPRGRPRRSLYLFDGIHPSPAGYAIWTSVLRARIEADLGPPGAR